LCLLFISQAVSVSRSELGRRADEKEGIFTRQVDGQLSELPSAVESSSAGNSNAAEQAAMKGRR